jgi:hypothetical protein
MTILSIHWRTAQDFKGESWAWLKNGRGIRVVLRRCSVHYFISTSHLRFYSNLLTLDMVAFHLLFLLVTFASLALGSPTLLTSDLSETRSETTSVVDLTLCELALSNVKIAECGVAP